MKTVGALWMAFISHRLRPALRIRGDVSTVVQAQGELIVQAGVRVTVVTLDNRYLAEDRSACGYARVVAAHGCRTHGD